MAVGAERSITREISTKISHLFPESISALRSSRYRNGHVISIGTGWKFIRKYLLKRAKEIGIQSIKMHVQVCDPFLELGDSFGSLLGTRDQEIVDVLRDVSFSAEGA